MSTKPGQLQQPFAGGTAYFLISVCRHGLWGRYQLEFRGWRVVCERRGILGATVGNLLTVMIGSILAVIVGGQSAAGRLPVAWLTGFSPTGAALVWFVVWAREAQRLSWVLSGLFR